MFGALAREEAGGGLREDEADGEVGPVGESVQDVGELDGGDAAACCQEEVPFAVLGVVGGEEWNGGGGGRKAWRCAVG